MLIRRFAQAFIVSVNVGCCLQSLPPGNDGEDEKTFLITFSKSSLNWWILL